MTIGSLFDIGIIILADRIKNLYDDDEEDDTEEGEQNAVKLLEKPNEFHKENEQDSNSEFTNQGQNGRTNEIDWWREQSFYLLPFHLQIYQLTNCLLDIRQKLAISHNFFSILTRILVSFDDKHGISNNTWYNT